jgi:hypothetical protein
MSALIVHCSWWCGCEMVHDCRCHSQAFELQGVIARATLLRLLQARIGLVPCPTDRQVALLTAFSTHNIYGSEVWDPLVTAHGLQMKASYCCHHVIGARR